MAAPQVGSVGTLVGAGLETAGHYMQSHMLDLLDAGVANSLGALLFLIAGISAVFIITIGGNYKFGLWFFIGPQLFFWMVFHRVDSTGAVWNFGRRNYQQIEVYKINEGVAAGNAIQNGQPIAPARVSWFFHLWNDISSNIVQSFIYAMNLSNKNTDISFVNKAERYEAFLNPQVSDSKLIYFSQIMLNEKCADYYIASTQYYSVEREHSLDPQMQQRLKTAGDEPVMRINEIPRFDDFVSAFDIRGDLDTYLSQTNRSYDPSLAVSCRDIWEILAFAFEKEAGNILMMLSSYNLPPGMTPEEALEGLVKKMLVQRNDENIDATKIREDPNTGKYTFGGGPGGRDRAVMMLVQEITARTMVAEIQKRYHSFGMLEHGKSPPLFDAEAKSNLYADSREDVARSIRVMQAREKWQGKGDFLTAMLAMPYIQGLVLYFLAATFPFFAMSLVVPGRHWGFTLWLGLWMWVKLWDLGYAIVMIVDEMLYALLPHEFPIDPTQSVTATYLGDAKIAASIKTAMQADPTYSVHTYYNLLATCIMAVPVITAAMVKTAGGQIVHAVSQGFTKFSGNIGFAMASYAANKQATSQIGDIQRAKYQAVENAMWKELASNDVLTPLLASSGLQALNRFQSKRAGRSSSVDEKGNVRVSTAKGPNDPKRDAGFSNRSVNQLLTDLNGAAASQAEKIAFATLQYKLERVAFDASYDFTNMQRASDAVMLKWYSHGSGDSSAPINKWVQIQKAVAGLEYEKGMSKFTVNVVTDAVSSVSTVAEESFSRKSRGDGSDSGRGAGRRRR